MFDQIRNAWLRWRVNRARRKNTALRSEWTALMESFRQRSPLADKNIFQLRKLARRGHAQAAVAELNNRLVRGKIYRAVRAKFASAHA